MHRQTLEEISLRNLLNLAGVKRPAGFNWVHVDLSRCVDHDESCPRCGQQKLKKDPIGGFYLKCFGCGWEGW